MMKEFDIRAAAVKTMLEQGIERSDIRIEIPLDTSSSGGRADIVLLNNELLRCIELKSQRDKVDVEKLWQQISPYEHCFDAVGVIVDFSHYKKIERSTIAHCTRYHIQDKAVIASYYGHGEPKKVNSITHELLYPSYKTCVPYMARLLWREDIVKVIGKCTREGAFKQWRETMRLKDLRPIVIKALRQRPLNKWEEEFWKRFDATKDGSQ